MTLHYQGVFMKQMNYMKHEFPRTIRQKAANKLIHAVGKPKKKSANPVYLTQS